MPSSEPALLPFVAGSVGVTLITELVVFACFAVTIWHGTSEWKKGARHHAFQW